MEDFLQKTKPKSLAVQDRHQDCRSSSSVNQSQTKLSQLRKSNPTEDLPCDLEARSMPFPLNENDTDLCSLDNRHR